MCSHFPDVITIIWDKGHRTAYSNRVEFNNENNWDVFAADKKVHAIYVYKLEHPFHNSVTINICTRTFSTLLVIRFAWHYFRLIVSDARIDNNPNYIKKNFQKLFKV